MARKSGGGGGGSGGGESSNTGLIVTLVFFVLLSITLGIFTYFGYDGQTKYQSEAKAAKSAENAAKKSRDEEMMQKLALKIATGNYDPREDPKALSGLKASNADAFNRLVSNLGGIKWDANQERPVKSYQDLILDYQRQISDADKAKKTAENNLGEAQKQFDAEKAELNAKLTKANNDLKKAQEDLVATQAKKSDEFLASTQTTDKVSKELAEEKQKRADDQVQSGRTAATSAATIKSIREQLDVAKSKLEPPNSLENDTPKGKVLRVDRSSGLVYINLGSADFVKPLLAFAVLPADATGRSAATKDRKAALEVVSVLEPHLSSARVTDATNTIRDPILAGDLLFNPAWSPSQREHIALAGIIDLDGDGKDDTAEVIRYLERQGILVDAYVDFREKAIKGAGITERTSYLVLGERPILPASVAADVNNPISQAFLDVVGKIGDMEKKAQELGVQKVPVRRFLSLVGYKLPKVEHQREYSASTYLKIGVGSGTGEEKDKPKEK